MKSKLQLSVLAAVLTVFIPMTALSQVAPDRVPKVPEGPTYKYEAFVGWGYTSLNQVNQSRSGLQGVSGEVTRNFGDHIGLTLDGGHYAWGLTAANAGNPTVDLYLAGPTFRGDLYEKFSGFAHVLLGGAHTGGVTIQPNISFAGGAGIGVDYNRTARFSVRAFGDAIGSSFTLVPYQTGDSPHMRWNARAGVGVVYHF